MAGTGSKTASPDNSGVEGKFEDLLSLVLARSRGEVGNDAVENALSSIMSEHAPSSPDKGKTDAAANPGRITHPNKDNIIPDKGNYDDDDSEDDIPVKDNTSKGAATATKNNMDDITTKKVTPRLKKHSRERQEALGNIPLGKMGERMLITFGDGPCPELEVISSSLLATRATLQRAILDARALRRQLKENWHQARAVATQHRGQYSVKDELKKTSTGIQGSVADSELSFRAMDGCADDLRFDVPCGFDIPQLETLFPEEMGAYERWKKMHDAYQENSGENKPQECDELTVDNKEDEGVEPEEINSSRLIERLSNFDARTNKMGDDWYMKFADVRKGSFLPRSGGRKPAGENEGGKRKQPKKRGRPKMSRTSWQNFNPSSVIFLHWIGFDPRSALSPPNEETTHALGFLAYDLFGKIVETAVSLRLDSGKRNAAQSRSGSPLLELTDGDQLEKGNIEEALAEVDSKSLYSSSNIDLGKSAKVTQLYFGPGFEDRLELEMDELFGSKDKSLSQEEMKARKDEESLFSELPQLPTLLSNVSEVLGNKQKGDNKEVAPASAKKIRANE